MVNKQQNTAVTDLSQNFRLFLVVFIPAITLRLIFLLFVDEAALFFKYPYFAEKLANGESIGTRLADLSPVYLYLTALFRWLTPFDWNVLKLFQAVIGAINCWLTAELARQVFKSRPIGILAGLGLAAYGNLIILETTLEPTVFVILFNLLALLCLYRYADAQKLSPKYARSGWLLFSALFTGISVLTKPSFLLFIPLAIVWITILERHRLTAGKLLLRIFIFPVIVFSIVGTITARNYLLLDDIILVTADAGKVFYHGNAAQSTALKWAGLPDQGFIEEKSDEPDYAHVAFRDFASKMAGKKLHPSEASKFWTRKTLSDITADPGLYFRRQLEKLLFFFSDYELHYIASAYTEYRNSRSLPFVRFSWIVALGVMGMLVSTGQFTRLLPVYGMVLLYLTSSLIFVVQSRYRIPVAPYLCLFAAYALSRIYHLAKSKRYPAAAIAITGSVAMVIASQTLLAEQVRSTDAWFEATKLHYEMKARPHFQAGRYTEAIAAATRALDVVPAFAPAYNLRGKSQALLKNHRAAIADFKTVVRLHPHRPEGYRNLGFAYLVHNDTAPAILNLEKALVLDPEDEKTAAILQSLRREKSSEQ